MPGPGRKRRLPVLSTADAATSAAVGGRPWWRWLLLGVALIVVAWLPLAVLVAVAMQRWALARFAAADQSAAHRGAIMLDAAAREWLALIWAVASLLSLALAAILGGLALGRWGGAVAARQSAGAGLCVALLAVSITAAQLAAASGLPGLVTTLLIAVAVAAGAARLGAGLGVWLLERRRARPTGRAGISGHHR